MTCLSGERRREEIILKVQCSVTKKVTECSLIRSATWRLLLYNAEFIYECEQSVYEMEDETCGLPICSSGTDKRQVRQCGL